MSFTGTQLDESSQLQVRGRQTPYDFIYMWNLKNQINPQTKSKLIIDTESGLVVIRGEQVGGLGESGEGIEKYSLGVTGQSPECEVQRRGQSVALQ